jgi:hypothetical protein
MSGNSGGRILGASTSVSGATLVTSSHKSELHVILITITLTLAAIVMITMLFGRFYRRLFK